MAGGEGGSPAGLCRRRGNRARGARPRGHGRALAPRSGPEGDPGAYRGWGRAEVAGPGPDAPPFLPQQSPYTYVLHLTAPQH